MATNTKPKKLTLAALVDAIEAAAVEHIDKGDANTRCTAALVDVRKLVSAAAVHYEGDDRHAVRVDVALAGLIYGNGGGAA